MDVMVQRRSTQLNMRIDPALKAAAEKAAVDARYSLSGLIEKLLTDYCREGGYLEEGRRPKKRGRS